MSLTSLDLLIIERREKHRTENPPELLAALEAAGECFGQANLLSTATDEERREALKRFFDWWNNTARQAIAKAKAQ